MKITGRLLVFFLLSIVWCSCNNGDKKDSQSIKPNQRDSIIRKPQQMAMNPYAPVDLSPMDMSYYPTEYPILKMTKEVTGPPVARVIYSRPHLEGRQLFQNLLKYGEPWRLGANESTELQLFRDVTIQNQKIKAGRYVLYCIPHPDKWTIILNSNIDSWGLEPDSTKDIASFNITVQQTSRNIEHFTMAFAKIDTGAELIMTWENLEARLQINF